MDVIACHQAGMAEVVATSGTALTDEQITLLKRYSPNLRMAFDADAAGQAAAKRGIDLALQAGMSIRVIQIPDGAGKDPDECIKKNKDTWFAAVDAAQDIMEWYLERAFRDRSLHEAKDRQKIVDDVLPEIGRIPFAVEQDFWLRELAGRVGVDVAILREDMKRFRHDKKSTSTTSHAPAPDNRPLSATSAPALTRVGMMVERLIGLVVRFPVLFEKGGFDRLPTQAIMVSTYAPLYEQWKVLYTTNTPFTSILHDTVREHIGEQGLSILLMKAELDFSDFKEKEAREEYLHLTARITDEWKKERRKALQFEIERLERSGNTADLARAMAEFQSL